MGGNSFTGHTVDTKTYVLASGAALRPLYTLQGNKIINIGVDINGQKGPNILGRDFFDFVINDDGSVGGLQSLHGSSMDSELATLKTHCSSYEKPLASQQLTENDGACFNYLLKNNWEMDY